MSAQDGASISAGTAHGAYVLMDGAASLGAGDRVGLVVDGPEDSNRLRLGRLAGSEPGARWVLAVERDAAPAWLAALEDLHPLAPSPLAILIVNLIERLAEAGPAMETADAAATIESILLLARTIREHPASTDAPEAVRSDPDLLAAAQLIEARLLDPDLDAAVLVQALGLSRSSLYRAFQPVGGVNAWIRQRRLEHARDLLANRTGPRPTVGEVAQICGFASDSHFSRAFRKAFGHSPGARGADSGGA